jgi:hypothetical protein
MSLTVKGNIIKVMNLESGVSKAGNEWKKQEFILEFQEQQFARKICFSLFNDKTALLKNLQPGQEVEVAFNLESREFNGKWYTNVNAWKIDPVKAANAPEGLPKYSFEDIPPEPMDDGTNDLPF